MSLNVFFVDTIGNPISLQLTRDMKFSEAVKNLQIKSGIDFTPFPIIFIFKSRLINKDCDQTLSELGIENMSKIVVTSNHSLAQQIAINYNPNMDITMPPTFYQQIPTPNMAPPLSIEYIIKENEIKVIFEKGLGQRLTLKLKKNMKFSEVASMYCNKMNLDEEEDELRFIYNAKAIDFSKTLDELGIKDNSRIYVIGPSNIEGAAGLSIKSILENEVNEDVSTKKKSGKKIRVTFQINGMPISTSLKDNIMFAEVTMQFCSQIGHIMNIHIETDKVKFIFNEKEIKSYSYKTLAELGISNYALILVIISETNKDEGSNAQNIIEKEEKLNNIVSKEAEKKSLKKEEKNNIIKKYDLNLIYYDENLKTKENSDNCTFFDMNINGTFYGCHYFELFKIVCKKIKNTKKEFILISSGSCSEKVFENCSNIKSIREYYIYCFDVDKYKPLMEKYPKLKRIYDIFEK